MHLGGGREDEDPGQQRGSGDQAGECVEPLGPAHLYGELPGGCVEGHLQAKGHHQQDHTSLKGESRRAVFAQSSWRKYRPS